MAILNKTVRNIICIGNQCLDILDAVENTHIVLPESPAVAIAELTEKMKEEVDVRTRRLQELQSLMETEKEKYKNRKEINKDMSCKDRLSLSNIGAEMVAAGRTIERIQNKLVVVKDDFNSQINEIKERFNIDKGVFNMFIENVKADYKFDVIKGPSGSRSNYINVLCDEIDDLIERLDKEIKDLIVEIINTTTQSSTPVVIGSAVDNVLNKLAMIAIALIRIGSKILEIDKLLKELQRKVESLRINEFKDIPKRIKALNLSEVISFGDFKMPLTDKLNELRNGFNKCNESFEGCKKDVMESLGKDYTLIDEKQRLYAKYQYEYQINEIVVIGADIYQKHPVLEQYTFKYHVNYYNKSVQEALSLSAIEMDKMHKEQEKSKQNVELTNLRVVKTTSGKMYISK